jgi:hypothetical protein
MILKCLRFTVYIKLHFFFSKPALCFRSSKIVPKFFPCVMNIREALLTLSGTDVTFFCLLIFPQTVIFRAYFLYTLIIPR